MRHPFFSIFKPRRAGAPGFTLVEILLALAIFAIGMAMVASVAPVGLVMGKATEDDIIGIIAAKNAASVIEAKKIHTLGFEHAYMHDMTSEGAYKNSSNDGEITAVSNGNQGFASVGYDNRPNDGDTRFDYEDVISAYSTGGWPSGGYIGNPKALYCRGFGGASAFFRTQNDTNNDGYGGDGGNGYHYDDATDLTMGRIHVCHNRVSEGELFPSGQIWYPMSGSADNQRSVATAVLIGDANASVSNRKWIAMVASLRMTPGTWPERTFSPTDQASRCPSNSDALFYSPAATTDGGGNPHPNQGWPIGWGYFESYSASGENTDTGLPGLFNLPMIVYDYKTSRIMVCYPPCYNPDAKWKGYTTDRRLKVGEKFITLEGGYVLTVVATSEVPGSDKHLQIVEVSPALSTTLLGPNSGGVDTDPNWRLRRGYFAPCPVEGGDSPLVHIETVTAGRGFTTNPNN